MAISLNPTDDSATLGLDADTVSTVSGTLDDRIVSILNDPNQSFSREELIRMIIGSQFVHLVRLTFNNPIVREATIGYLERRLDHALRNGGLDPTVEIGPSGQPLALNLLDYNAAAVLSALNSRIQQLLTDPNLAFTQAEKRDLIYGSVAIDTLRSLYQDPLIGGALRAYFEQELQRALQERGIHPTEVSPALSANLSLESARIRSIYDQTFPKRVA